MHQSLDVFPDDVPVHQEPEPPSLNSSPSSSVDTPLSSQKKKPKESREDDAWIQRITAKTKPDESFNNMEQDKADKVIATKADDSIKEAASITTNHEIDNVTHAVEPIVSIGDDSIISTSTINDNNNITSANTVGNWTSPPKWITNYVEWHQKTRLEYENLTNPNNLPPMLVVYCRAACGGLHDRLGSLPFDFYAANQTRRLLLYMWRVPVKLEELLVPPEGATTSSKSGDDDDYEAYSFDWRVPEHLQGLVDKAPSLFRKGHGGGTDPLFWNETLPLSIATIGWNHSSLPLITLKDRFHNGEFFLEDKLRELGETDMIHLTPTFGWLWNRVFTPSPGLSQYIHNAKRAMGITKGKYVAVHCRIHYPLLLDEWFGKKSHPIKTVDGRGGPDTSGILLDGPGKEFGVGIGLHALQCARTLLRQEDEPIYFFSDANNLVEYLARNVTAATLNQSDIVDVQAQPILEHVQVVTRPDIHERNYHIDQARRIKDPKLYFALFADLYIAMEARCILFGYGGFGRFAQQLTSNPCYMQHQLHIHDPFFGHSLNMHDNVCTNDTYAHLTMTTTTTTTTTTSTEKRKLLNTGNDPSSQTDAAPASTAADGDGSDAFAGMTARIGLLTTNKATPSHSIEFNSTTNDGRASPHNSTEVWKPPSWISDYMAWHRKVRLEYANATDLCRFPPMLVVFCNARCGGLHDRLGSLPFEFYAANQTRRLLFYMWRVPVDLEEFLVPPDPTNTFDWRVPQQLRHLVDEAPTLFPERHRGGTHTSFWNQTLPDSIAERGLNHSMQILTLKDSFHNGEFFLEDKLRELGETDMIHLTPTFRWLWKQMFTPSLGLSQYISETKVAMGTSAGNYVAVHCRVHYPQLLMDTFVSGSRPFGAVGNPDRKGMVLEGTMKDFGVGVGLHAIQCAQSLLQRDNEPIYFFSDANNLVEYMARNASHRFNQSDSVDIKARPILEKVLVIARPDIHQRNYHIDLATINDARVYYALFADLYLAMEARCILFGYGGFGRFAQQLSGNKCYLQHQLHIHKPYFGHSLNMHDNVCTNETYGGIKSG